jgi:hypothetical protein
VFRTGEHKFPETSPETQRITLNLPVSSFETAETLAAKLKKPSVREYCSELLRRVIEEERLLHQVEEFESKHGALEGLAEIARDPEYLSEWEALSRARTNVEPDRSVDAPSSQSLAGAYVPFGTVPPFDPTPDTATLTPEILFEPEWNGEASLDNEAQSPTDWSVEPLVTSIREIPMGRPLQESAADVVKRHAGLDFEDHWSFLPCLRRGQAVPASMIDELLESLERLREESGGEAMLDRSIAHSLHRLALESQVLLTEAWPGAFDERMVLAIRSVQEAVERHFSGSAIPSQGSSEPVENSEPSP